MLSHAGRPMERAVGCVGWVGAWIFACLSVAVPTQALIWIAPDEIYKWRGFCVLGARREHILSRPCVRPPSSSFPFALPILY